MRRGISLTEVLVALFIMALGVIAILTMFPMGLITMGQALKDDRATQCAYQAEAYMRWYWRDQVLSKPTPTEPFYDAMNSPGGTLPAILPSDPEASYPVLVDPMGVVMGNGDWIGTGSGQPTAIRRHSLSLITTQPPASHAPISLRTCSLMDTMGFSESGQPATDPTGTTIDRTLPYNFAWLLQRETNREQSTAKMTVLVYDKRVHLFQPSAKETVFTPTVANVGQTSLTFPDTFNAPKGGWLLDASSTAPGGSAGVRNANFYRVVSVTPDTANGTVNVELQTPLKDHSGNAAGFTAADWRFVVMDGLYEVFEMPALTR